MMNNRERLKLIIQNWFVEKTSIKPTEDGLNNLVDRIYYDKQLNIHVVVKQSELLFCSDCNIDLKKADGFCPKYVDCEELKTK